MMKRTLAIIAILFGQVLSQPYNWTLQNPYPTANDLNSIYLIDSNNALTIGAGGIILNTDDGGQTWNAISSGTTAGLYAVHFPTATTGYIVGDNPAFGEQAVILKTSDGGSSWSPQTSTITYGLSDVFFINENTGWAVGDGGYSSSGFVLKTINGGTDWVAQTSNTTNEELTSVFFIDENNGWAASDRYIIKTTDGGTTWTEYDVAGSDYNTLRYIYFTDANTGWVCGPALYKTVDGGLNWAEVTVAGDYFQSMAFSDAGNFWLVSSEQVFGTTDGGSTWTEQIDLSGLTGETWIWSIDFSDANNGWFVGSSGLIYHTTNAGTDWNSATTSFNSGNIESVFFLNADHGWVAGWLDDIYTTADGGATWTVQSTPASQQLYDIEFIDATTGWAVGDNPYGAEANIYYTTNGGGLWTQQTNGNQNPLYAVDFVSATTGWAVGYAGVILHTTDSGTTWTPQTSTTTNALEDVFFLDASTGWIAGRSGTILKTVDGGANWTVQSSGISQMLTGIYFLDANHGFTISSDKGYILETTNGGDLWTAIAGGSYDDPANRGIHFADVLNGWIVGAEGHILTTSDGGTTWVEQNSNTGADLNAVHFVDGTTGWAAGDNGAILKYEISAVSLTAALSATPTSGDVPLTVQFTDLSTGGPTSWAWDFENDGTVDATLQHPSFTYSLVGIYSVSLTVSDGSNSESITKTGYITVTDVGGGPEPSPILYENFDGGQVPPGNWSTQIVNTTNTWRTGNVSDHDFSSVDPTNVYSAVCPWVAADQDEWLITPAALLGTGANLVFYAGYSTAFLSSATLKLHVTTNSGTSWTQLWEAVNDGQTWSWRRQVIDLSAYAGGDSIQLAWQYVGNDGDIVAIDSVLLNTGQTVGIVEEAASLPIAFQLHQNYPNPFNPSTTIAFNFPAATQMNLTVYDLLGREIRHLVNMQMGPGVHHATWDGKNNDGQDVATGVYIAHLVTPGYTKSVKMVLLK